MTQTLEAVVRRRWLSPEEAVREVVAFERRFGEEHLKLACHCGLLLILTPELVNLVRINFLEDIPWIAESNFLLSPLCRPLQEGIYEVEPCIREVLLVELENKFGWQRPFELAEFLWYFLDKQGSRKQRPEFKQVQQWVAKAYLKPDSTIRDFKAILDENLSHDNERINLDNQGAKIPHLIEILADPLEATNLWDEYQYLVNTSRAVTKLLVGEREGLREELEESTELEEGELVLISPIIEEFFRDIEVKNLEKTFNELKQIWQSRLEEDEPKLSKKWQKEIIQWLGREDTQKLQAMTPEKLAVIQQGFDYRYRSLRERYLHTSATQAYRRLINRLGSVVVIRQKIRTWVSLSWDRQRAVADVLQETVQEMCVSDRYIQSQIDWIAKCTDDKQLRNILLFTTIEEYCLRPIRNQPLLAYRLLDYFRGSQKIGITQVPQHQMIRIMLEDFSIDTYNEDYSQSLWDSISEANYQVSQEHQEQEVLRPQVKAEFEAYLAEEIGEEAKQWLGLYLQGKSQEEIARLMNLSTKQAYRLREKIGYHAIKIFAIKNKPELVADWLGISLHEHSLGLTSSQWQYFYQKLSQEQRELIKLLTAKKTVEDISQQLGWKPSKIYNEWTQLYLEAQALRND